MPSLDVLHQPTSSEGNATRAEQVLCKVSGTLSREDSKDGTNLIIPSLNSKSHIFETKRENIEVHVRCVDSLQNSEKGSASIESKNNEDITMGFGACPNQRTIGALQTSFGKLFRIGTMGDVTWTTEIPTKPCCFVFAHPCPTKGRGTNGDQESMSQVSKCDEQNEAFCNNTLMVVDTFVNDTDRRHLASFIGCELPSDSGDPKGLKLYILWVAKFGFNHIIIIGEIDYGMIFLDCYGRVFMWEDMMQVLWPMGDSLEEVKLNHGKDKLFWVVEDDGIVYEFESPPEHVYTTIKKAKKKKKHQKRH
ncbi:11132_t:CDS:2 [Ambispora leptoticha]|uniref:11132_t:CDS:1 n=1 Tax=Ambispora leptoticha TaxID=144679 RepID=A0A9N9G8B3_9GLOM|nr:11132_t:CDS:2 [Ambispora leptoticha]